MSQVPGRADCAHANLDNVQWSAARQPATRQGDDKQDSVPSRRPAKASPDDGHPALLQGSLSFLPCKMRRTGCCAFFADQRLPTDLRHRSAQRPCRYVMPCTQAPLFSSRLSGRHMFHRPDGGPLFHRPAPITLDALTRRSPKEPRKRSVQRSALPRQSWHQRRRCAGMLCPAPRHLYILLSFKVHRTGRSPKDLASVRPQGLRYPAIHTGGLTAGYTHRTISLLARPPGGEARPFSLLGGRLYTPTEHA